MLFRCRLYIYAAFFCERLVCYRRQYLTRIQVTISLFIFDTPLPRRPSLHCDSCRQNIICEGATWGKLLVSPLLVLVLFALVSSLSFVISLRFYFFSNGRPSSERLSPSFQVCLSGGDEARVMFLSTGDALPSLAGFSHSQHVPVST
jgi:hypothetical protein